MQKCNIKKFSGIVKTETKALIDGNEIICYKIQGKSQVGRPLQIP